MAFYERNNLLKISKDLDDRTPAERKSEFLDKYYEIGIMQDACKATRISRQILDSWKKHDEAFLEAFNEIRESIQAWFEDEVIRRGVTGVEENVWHQGNVVGTRRVYSDKLLELLMKAQFPEKYREKRSAKNETTNNTVLIMPSNGREVQLPASMPQVAEVIKSKIREEDIPDISI